MIMTFGLHLKIIIAIKINFFNLKCQTYSLSSHRPSPSAPTLYHSPPNLFLPSPHFLSSLPCLTLSPTMSYPITTIMVKISSLMNIVRWM